MFYSSYLFYVLTIILATIFAGFAQKYSKINSKGLVRPNTVYNWISMLILIFVLGLRDISIGVDGYNYLLAYNRANSMGILEYYSNNTTEPGFYLIYIISGWIGDFQWVFIITAFITIYFFYKALSYELEKLNYALLIFIFGTTQYFYYFGIMRMGIAVAIVAYSFKYIIENKKKKYIVFNLIASCFHYSALFALLFLYLNRTKNNIFKKNNIIKIIFIIPIGFLGVRILIYPFIKFDRYQSYIESSGIISLDFVSTLPLIALFFIHYNQYTEKLPNYQFYFYLFLVKFVTEIFAPLIGIGRMVWFVNISLCFLFVITIQLNKNKAVRFIILLLAISYSLFYAYFAYFGDSPRGELMLPYKNVYFQLQE